MNSHEPPRESPDTRTRPVRTAYARMTASQHDISRADADYQRHMLRFVENHDSQCVPSL